MPRGGARPGAGRPRKQPEEKLKANAKKPSPKKTGAQAVDAEGYKTDPKWPFGQERPPEPPPPEDLSEMTPLDYLLRVMRDPEQPEDLRMRAAQNALPFCHPKKGESSAKKEEAEARKKAATSGKFARRQPPTLVASGGKNV